MTTEERVKRLEREVRWTRVGGEARGSRWKLVAAVLLGAAAVASFAGLAQDEGRGTVPESLKARRFDLVNSAGEARASLGFTDDGAAALQFRDKNGKVRLAVSCGDDGSSAIRLIDAKGKHRLVIEAHSAGRTRLYLKSESENAMAALVQDSHGARIGVYGSGDRAHAALKIDGEENSHLVLSNGDAGDELRATTIAKGSAGLMIRSKGGKVRVALGTAPDGKEKLILLDKEGRPSELLPRSEGK